MRGERGLAGRARGRGPVPAGLSYTLSSRSEVDQLCLVEHVPICKLDHRAKRPVAERKIESGVPGSLNPIPRPACPAP